MNVGKKNITFQTAEVGSTFRSSSHVAQHNKISAEISASERIHLNSSGKDPAPLLWEYRSAIRVHDSRLGYIVVLVLLIKIYHGTISESRKRWKVRGRGQKWAENYKMRANEGMIRIMRVRGFLMIFVKMCVRAFFESYITNMKLASSKNRSVRAVREGQVITIINGFSLLLSTSNLIRRELEV